MFNSLISAMNDVSSMGTRGMQRNTSTYSLDERIRLNLIKKFYLKTWGKAFQQREQHVQNQMGKKNHAHSGSYREFV